MAQEAEALHRPDLKQASLPQGESGAKVRGSTCGRSYTASLRLHRAQVQSTPRTPIGSGRMSVHWLRRSATG